MKQKSIRNNLTPFCRYVREGTLLGRKASPPESWAGHCVRNFLSLSKNYEIFFPWEGEAGRTLELIVAQMSA